MLDYVKFFYSIYQDIGDKAKKHEFLRSIILAESRFNNELSSVIRRSGPPQIAASNPEIYLEFQTSSLDLLTSLGIPSHTVFDEKKEPTEQDLSNLESGNRTLAYYSSRPQAELYEFYVRKCRLLTALSKSKSITAANISLSPRIRNIEYATRFLSQHLAAD